MAFIYNLSDTWNDVATTWNGIKLAVTNSGADSSSKLLNLTVTGASTASFVVDKSGNLVLNGSVNKITMTAPATGATLTLADGSTFATSGAYSSTFTFSGTTTLTFPTSGTVTALGNTTTGSGSIVLATSPTLVTPALGTPTSGDFSSGTFTWPTFNQNTTGTAANVTGVVAIANGGTSQTTANAAFNALAPSQGGNSGKYLTTDGSNTSWATNPLGTVTSVDVSGGSTGLSFSGGPITTSGTITMAGTLAAANGGTGLTSLGTGVATWLGTPSSANLAAAVTDETGSGPLVFATSPRFTSQVTFGTASSTRGTLVLANTSANTVTLQSSNSTAAAYTLTLPAAAPVNGYYLQTDNLGVLSWAAGGGGGGGSPGGSNTQVQFNDSATFGGEAAFTYTKATYTLGLGVASTTTGTFNLYNSASANAVSLKSGNNASAWSFTLPTGPGTNGYALTTDGSGNTSWSNIAGITVGTTTISGGTSGRVLYDNAGVVGEYPTSATTVASSVVLRDANVNITSNAFFAGTTSTAATGGTTTLTAASTPVNVVTGSGGQTFTLPDATTLPLGAIFSFNNNQTSGTIVVKNTGATTIATFQSGAYGTIVLIANGTSSGTWEPHFQAPANVSWSTNTLDYPGSITSATWNGVAVAVNRGGTGLTSGTSGGVLYYSAAGTLASSAALAASSIVLGGGAGAAPATTTTGTGVVTAIGNATNGASGLAVLNGSGFLAVAQGGTATGTAGIGAFNNITGYTAAGATGTTSTNLVFSTSPTLVTPVLGAATATSINGLTITSSTGTLTVTNGKILSASNTLTLAGTDSTTMTFPATSSTVLTTGNTATITKGYTVTPNNIGTVSSGTTTPDPANGNYQYYTNNGAHTLAAPSSDCAIDILVTNGASAGAITFSGFTVGSSTGSTYATTNAQKYLLSIRRINGTSTYSWYALQ